MNRLSLLLIMLVGLVLAVYTAPGFVFDTLITAFLIVFGARWFFRAAHRPRGRGVWR